MDPGFGASVRESHSIVPFPAPLASRDRQDHGIPEDALAMLVDLACDFAVADSTLYQLGMQVPDVLPQLRSRLGTSVRIELQRGDLNRGIALRNACVAILPHVSRELRPLRRTPLIGDVYRGLRDGGCALVIETVRGRNSLLNNLFASHTHVPRRDEMAGAGTVDEEHTLLGQAGFRSVEVFYKRYGVCGLIAVK
jgi:tRNA (cmo5U34)-methyltransferase